MCVCLFVGLCVCVCLLEQYSCLCFVCLVICWLVSLFVCFFVCMCVCVVCVCLCVCVCVCVVVCLFVCVWCVLCVMRVFCSLVILPAHLQNQLNGRMKCKALGGACLTTTTSGTPANLVIPTAGTSGNQMLRGHRLIATAGTSGNQMLRGHRLQPSPLGIEEL